MTEQASTPHQLPSPESPQIQHQTTSTEHIIVHAESQETLPADEESTIWAKERHELFLGINEFVGTTVYLFFGLLATQGALKSDSAGNSSSNTLTIATAFGFSYAITVLLLGDITGGHFNPAVSIAFLSIQSLSFIRTIHYVIFQIIGGIFGAWLAQVCSGYGMVSFNVPQSSAGVSVLFEIIGTFFFVWAMMILYKEEGFSKSFRAFLLGIALLTCYLAGVPVDGASINPVRSFGPSVISGNFTDHWVFWVGPIIGALAAAWFWTLENYTSKEKKE